MHRLDSPVSVLLERGDPTFGAAASVDEITAAGGGASDAAAEQQTAWQRVTAAAWFPHVVLFVAQVANSDTHSLTSAAVMAIRQPGQLLSSLMPAMLLCCFLQL
jgi:hypothetical protein